METPTYQTELQPPLEEHPTVESVDPRREAALRQLLPTDYEFATESGLIDMFYYDPNSGYDGLLHTLAGDVLTGGDGAKVAEGFHHEPSAAVWSAPSSKHTPQALPTRVDREHLMSLKSDKRRQYREYPYEPYAAKVLIDGVRKLGKQVDPETGAVKITEASNGMFPKEYDALAVMQAVRITRDKRDRSADRSNTSNDGHSVLVSESYAPMLDGQSLVKLRLILDAETEKVITAIPFPKPGIMKLSRAAIKGHLGI